jgi:hypothetical protein
MWFRSLLIGRLVRLVVIGVPLVVILLYVHHSEGPWTPMAERDARFRQLRDVELAANGLTRAGLVATLGAAEKETKVGAPRWLRGAVSASFRDDGGLADLWVVERTWPFPLWGGAPFPGRLCGMRIGERVPADLEPALSTQGSDLYSFTARLETDAAERAACRPDPKGDLRVTVRLGQKDRLVRALNIERWGKPSR